MELFIAGFFMCIAGMTIYLWRDHKADYKDKRAFTQILTTQQKEIDKLNAWLKSTDSLRATVMSQKIAFEELAKKVWSATDLHSIQTIVSAYQSAFESDFNGLNKRCERLEKTSTRHENNMEYLRGRVEVITITPTEPIKLPAKFKTELKKASQQLKEF